MHPLRDGDPHNLEARQTPTETVHWSPYIGMPTFAMMINNAANLRPPEEPRTMPR
jgi:hypothetical protein